MRHNPLELILLTILTLVAALIPLLGWNTGGVLAVFGTLLVLFLPGYVLSIVILPHLKALERMLVTLGTSLTVTMLGALLLHQTPWGLIPSAWAIWLSVVTLVGILFAWVRQRYSGPTSDSASLPTLSWKKIHWPSLALYGAAVVITLAAVYIANVAAQDRGEPFTLFAAKVQSESPQYTLKLDVQNHEERAMAYRVVIQSNRKTIYEQPLELASQKVWSSIVEINPPPQAALQLYLYRSDAPDSPYRTLRIVPTLP